MKKVENVINGYLSQYNVKNLHILNIDENKVIFGGDIEKFSNPIDSMADRQKEICKAEVKNSICDGKSIYLFV